MKIRPLDLTAWVACALLASASSASSSDACWDTQDRCESGCTAEMKASDWKGATWLASCWEGCEEERDRCLARGSSDEGGSESPAPYAAPPNTSWSPTPTPRYQRPAPARPASPSYSPGRTRTSARRSDWTNPHDTSGRPCITASGKAVEHTGYPGNYEHKVEFTNGCAARLDVRVCYQATNKCTMPTVPAGGKATTTLGVMKPDSSFSFDYGWRVGP